MWQKQSNCISRIHQWHQKNRDKSEKQHGGVSISIKAKKEKRVIKLESQRQGAITAYMLLSHTRQYLHWTTYLVVLFYTWFGQREGFQLWMLTACYTYKYIFIRIASLPQFIWGTILSWECIYIYVYVTCYLVECCVHILLPVGDQKLRWGIMAFWWYHNGYYSPQ